MLENNNLKICRRLAKREFRFHPKRSLLLILAASLTCGLYSFIFLLGNAVRESYLLNFEYACGFSSHIQYTGLTADQADALCERPEVKNAARTAALGQLSGRMLGFRTITLAAADQAYAESISAFPTHGRFPQAADEIALDSFTMDSLGIPHEMGQKVTLEWRTADGRMRESSFILCGWWTSPAGYSESCAWVSPEGCRKLLSDWDAPNAVNVMLGVTLHQPKELDVQAQRLLDETGILESSFRTNPAYNPALQELASKKALPFYLPFIMVMLCGFLMIYSILLITLERDLSCYAGLKMLGMTPRQIRSLLFGQAFLSWSAAVLPGWMLGFSLYFLLAGRIIVGLDVNCALFFMSWKPLLAAALLSMFNVWSAYLLQVRKLENRSPAQVLLLDRRLPGKPRKPADSKKAVSLTRLAARSLPRSGWRLGVSMLSLLFAILMLCSAWIRYQSYDEEIYLSACSPWDYSLIDGSAYTMYQRYNPDNHAITEDTVRELEAREEVISVSTLKTHELELTASDELQKLLTDYYNGTSSQGNIRRTEMEGFPEWCAGLDRLEQTGHYTGLVVGLDGEYLRYFADDSPPVDGSFSEEEFLGGSFCLTSGAADDTLSSLPSGAFVELAGRKFEVMAALVGNDAAISGGNSAAAAFNLIYFIPLDVFNEMFPGQGIRQLAVNIEHSRQKSFEKYLTAYEKSLNRGVAVVMRSDYQKSFESGRLNNSVLAEMIEGNVLLLIGLLSFMNLLAAKTFLRKREFAVYESLGMTDVQLKKLLVLEGLMHAGALTLTLVPAVFLITWFGMPAVFSRLDSWCMTYHYTLLPLWASVALIWLTAVIVPMGCLRTIRSASLSERLRSVE